MTDDNKARTADNLDDELATLPDKYKGKSVAEVVRMHQEAEQLNSRLGNEIGEYRKLALTLAETSTRTPEKTEVRRPEVTTDDLFADPAKAIDDVIESHPVVKKARETTENLERQLAQREFESRHPSFKEDLSDPEFVKWVQSNPSLLKMAQRADSYDFDAADQLFGLWHEKKSVKQEVERKTKEVVEKKEKERAGMLEGNSGADSSSESIYSRAELRELQRKALMGDRSAAAKWNDPKFQAARKAAYAAGRVR
jgi:hypothetical protein